MRVAVVLVVVIVQLAFIVRAYSSDHKVFGFQMFPEASTWQANVVRVTRDGRRVPVEEGFPGGYSWNALVGGVGLQNPSARHHADAGLNNQLAFLRSSLNWVADHTPRDHETRYLEARVTSWHNDDSARVRVYRSHTR